MKYEVNGENFESYDDAVEYCHEQEIIYYHNAMAYLSENDPSLRDSIAMAIELGFKDINSELLATLYYQTELINSIEKA